MFLTEKKKMYTERFFGEPNWFIYGITAKRYDSNSLATKN